MKNYTIRDCSLLLVICAIAYLPFLGLPGWDGNEPIRVIIAKEMLQTGNWIMPILHGKPYYAKPPMMNWLIAASGTLFGSVNEWSSRLPSVLMMLLTSLSVYFLTKKWLGKEGRLFAALMTLTMIGLIKKGREAEIDSLHIWVISFILLVWINGYIRQWKPAILWGLTLSLVGIGFLSKGPQVIIFFYMTLLPYLILRKRVSFFFSRAHLFGIGLLLLFLGGYLLLILQWTTLDQYTQRWIGEGMSRAESKSSLSFLQHVLSYPLEVAGSFMPWLLFLTPLILYKELWQKIKKTLNNEIFVFSLVVIAANFPLYWFLPNMRSRYFLPAGPFVALVVAVIFELYLGEMQAFPGINTFFKKFLKVFTLLAILSAIAVIPVVFLMHLNFSFSIFFLIACTLSVALFILYKIRSVQLTHIPIYVTLITAVYFLIYTDLGVQYDSKQENYPRKIAQEINLLLPSEADTVYELGYRRFLGITCYIDREVRQLDTFDELKSLEKKKGKIYFIFDTEFLNAARDKDKNIFLHEIHWEKIYSKKYKGRRGDIVVGTLS